MSQLCHNIQTFLPGVGGVHRGAENSMDISADLIELGKTSMAGKLMFYSRTIYCLTYDCE